MKKVLALAIMLLAFCLVGCSQNDDINDLAQPQTNLEFWIAENVDNVDFSDYQIKYGMMGGTEYYGTGYIPEVDECKCTYRNTY